MEILIFDAYNEAKFTSITHRHHTILATVFINFQIFHTVKDRNFDI